MTRSRLGRLLCKLGFHRTEPRREVHRRLAVVERVCTRPGCERLPEILELKVRPRKCICGRHAVNSFCPLHGTFPHEKAAA